jgi:hypothetical protein
MNNTPKKTKTLYLKGVAVGQVEATGDREKDMEVARQFLKDRGLYKEITLIEAMFRHAVSFASTAAYVYERDLKDVPRNVLGIAPFVVNSAFSIELYLKTLNQIHGNIVKGHSLLALYDALPQKGHQAIRNAASRYANEYHVSKNLNFRSLISEVNNAFVEWRYCYEEGQTDLIKIQPMIFFMKVLHEACKASIAT